jgi:hypothetical protein
MDRALLGVVNNRFTGIDLIAGAAVTLSAGSPSIAGAYNVASLTDNGTGDITVTFAKPMSNANYVAVATAFDSGANYDATVAEKLTSAVRIVTRDLAGTPTDVNFSVLVVSVSI